jgi:hypothetical protein
MADEHELPLPLRGHGVEVPFSRDQLIPTAARLQDAVSIDLSGAEGADPPAAGVGLAAHRRAPAAAHGGTERRP